MVVGQIHGILTGASSPTWPTFGAAFFAETRTHVVAVNSAYYALPLPRIEALRNRGRSRELARRIELAGAALRAECGCRADLALVSHSNGAVIAMQVARELIRLGTPIRSMVLIAPALRTRPASREIGEWLTRGMLEYALLVRPTRDLVIGGIARNWRTRLYAWPWGSLGHDGWDLDELDPYRLGVEMPETIDLPGMGHNGPVAPENREWLYREIIAPALGLARWGDVQPESMAAA
jgi:hypothetical protein